MGKTYDRTPRRSSAEALYNNGVLDLDAFSEWIEERESECAQAAARHKQAEEENRKMKQQLASDEPLVRQARSRMRVMRSEAERGLRSLGAGMAPRPQVEQLQRELNEADDQQKLEKVGRAIRRMFEEAYPVAPIARAGDVSSSKGEPGNWEAFRVSKTTS
jgi:hypothetical protein